jgi:PAS domain S-box-containing protein
MKSATLTSLYSFILVLLIGVLIYFNEHIFIRNIDSFVRDKIDVITAHLNREVQTYLTEGNRQKLTERISVYKKFPDVKLIAIIDSVGNVLCVLGDEKELKVNFKVNSKTLRYNPEKGIYEAFVPVSDLKGLLLIKLGIHPYKEGARKTSILIFTIITVSVIFVFSLMTIGFRRRVIKPIERVSGLMQDIARGVYNVQLDVPKSSDIYNFAENFNQMVKLLDEKERRLERQKSQFKLISEISRIGLEINSTEDFFKKVVSLIRDEFNFLNVSYFTAEPNGKLRLLAISGYLENYIDESFTYEPGYGIPGASALLADVVVINDTSKSPQFVPIHDAPILSEMSIPIKKKGKIVGVIDIASEKTNAFTSEDVKIFKTIGETISVVLEKFESMTENIRLIFKLETVYKLTRELVLLKDVEKIFSDAVKLIHSVLGKKEIVVEIYEIIGDKLVLRSIYGNIKEPLPYEYIQSIDEGVIGRAIKEKRVIYIPDIILEPSVKKFYMTTVSEVAVPLIVAGEPIGAINCESPQVNIFDDLDILVLQTIADMLSIAIQNARMYHKILESESKYKTIFENSSEAIIRINHEGKFIEVNPTFKKVFGFDDIESINFYQLFASDEIADEFRREISKRNFIANFDAQMKNKSGEILNVKISMRKFDDFYYDGVIVDLTEYMKALEKLHEADKLRGLAQIAGGIAHEFNNIFTGILGSAQLIKTKIPKEDKIYYWADIIERSVSKGADLVRKLIGYARGGKIKVSVANPNEMIIDVLKKIPPLENIKIKTELDPSVPEIECDREQLTQVLIDIAQNGIEAMPNGGTLTIRTGSGYYDKDKITEPGFNPGEYVHISISDTGIGMNDDVLKHIFEPFFTTKRALGKSGLGLSMAYGVIKNHGGFITVSSTLGQGTTFNIFLPVLRKERKIINGQLKTSKSKLKILVVDDEEFLRILLADLLGELGHEVIQAGNGVEALKIYKNMKDEIDLVILDIIMPFMDGFDVFKELKQIKSDVKVIFTSGFSADEKMMSNLTAVEPNVRYIQKPYQLNEIETAIKSLFGASQI